jgi:hypothetical protein
MLNDNIFFKGEIVSKSFKVFFSQLFLVQVKRSKKALGIMILTIGLSLGGTMSARAISFQEILNAIQRISSTLSQGLQTFAGILNVPTGSLDLPTTQETQQAITNIFGAGNPQASANNLTNNITSMNAASIANQKIWSKKGQEEQANITKESGELDQNSYDAAGDSIREAARTSSSDSSQEILRSISQQLRYQAIISDDQSRLAVIQNSLLQESNLQTSAANGSTASTQEMVAGQAKKKNIEEQDQLVGNLTDIERYLE